MFSSSWRLNLHKWHRFLKQNVFMILSWQNGVSDQAEKNEYKILQVSSNSFRKAKLLMRGNVRRVSDDSARRLHKQTGPTANRQADPPYQVVGAVDEKQRNMSAKVNCKKFESTKTERRRSGKQSENSSKKEVYCLHIRRDRKVLQQQSKLPRETHRGHP